MERGRSPADWRKQVHVRAVTGPAESFIDAHGDAPPYHDQHSDHDVYYDHADDKHCDAHTDETEAFTRFTGDPADLVQDSINRLTRVLGQFEAEFRARTDKRDAETAATLKQIEARLTALEKANKSR